MRVKRTQEERTFRGGQKIEMQKEQGETEEAQAKFDIGEAAAKKAKVRDMSARLSEPPPDEAPIAREFKRQEGQKGDDLGEMSMMERLRRARERARDEMKKDDDENNRET